MQSLIRTAFRYLIAALVGGVFYREFPKWMGYSGRTSLAFVHTHLMVLGTLMFLILALFAATTDLTGQSRFHSALRWYNLSLIGVVGLMLVRGVIQVVMTEVSRGLDFSISGIAGLTHVLFAIGLVLVFRLLFSVKALREA